MVEVFDSSSPTTAEEIRQFEMTYGITLPIEYKNFLLLHNGGRPEPNVFRIKEHKYLGDTDGRLGYFFPINEEDVLDSLSANLKVYKYRIPKELLPIAHDVAGNVICLCIEGNNLGKIYFWAHEYEDDPSETPTYENVFLIANNFEEFITNLMSEDTLGDS